MEDNTVVDIDMKGAPAGGRCFMLVARYAPQVVASTGYGKRPRLVAGHNGDRHRFQVREREVDRAA